MKIYIWKGKKYKARNKDEVMRKLGIRYSDDITRKLIKKVAE